MNLSEEQILLLAPDEPSRRAGRELANGSKWLSKGKSDRALWGECQGSGSKPYQTQIDTESIAFKCSCPSRKFPCKHGLGLLLSYAKNTTGFISTAPPSWVSEWISKRTEKEEKKSEIKEKPIDEAAQAKRLQARQSKVEDGIAELNTWLKDIIRNGIISLPEKSPSFFENISRRMIDAQAPGLAVMVRNLGESGFYSDKWASRFVEQVARIYMITQGYKNLNTLSPFLQQDIKTSIGFTQNQDELKEPNGLMDTWLILGKEISEADSVLTEKFWLYGTTNNRYALVLNFSVRGQGGALTLTPGSYIEAELVFFPSELPLRALIKRQISSPAVTGYKSIEGWNALAEIEADLNSLVPFRTERPFILHSIRTVKYNNQWWLQDSSNNIMKIKPDFAGIWKLLSITGGEPKDMAVLGLEEQFSPLGIWTDGQYEII
ncbi:MAG: SWIM zinc finger family protein [Gemmatimonadaceae bacterium]|nr:SWIM zinc finger family protein [Chitinophagaceae bacterium]